jgi:hypothetical protein
MSIPTILSTASAFLAILSLRNVKRTYENHKAYKELVHKALENAKQANTDMVELLKIIDNSETSDEILKKFAVYIDYKN